MARAASSGCPEVILRNLLFQRGARTAAAMLALLALAACGGGGSSGTATAPLTVPSTPAGLASTAVTAQSVTLSWSAATGATSYVVRRDGTTLATPSAPGYTDATVSAGTTYAYTVAASNAAGTSTPSPAVSVTTPAPPAAPTGLAASAVSDQAVALTWNASAGATAYVVTRDGATLASPSGTAYTDTTVSPATTYSYAVQASSAAGTSAPGAALSVTTPAALPVNPTVPAGLTAVAPTNTTVHLTWTASGPTATGKVSYRVYRDGAMPAIGTTTTASYDDSGLAQASTHSYTVQAYDAAGHSSAQSGAVGVTTPGPTVPGAVTALPASNTRITVSWTASADTLPVTSYLVARDGSFLSAVTSGTAYTDNAVAQASTHSYTVTASDGLYQSAPSAAASARTPGPTAPVLSLGSVTTGSATISWTASTDSLGTPLYRILRSYQGGSAGTLQDPATSPYTDTSFTVAGAYAYTIVAYDGQGYTAASNTVSTTVNVAAGAALSVSPRQVALAAGQVQQFTASAAGNAPSGTVTWSVDGTAGGSTALGTIDAAGLYTAPASAGPHTITAATSLNASGTGASAIVTDLKAVATYHYDNARTGQNLAEYALTQATLSTAGSFGKLFSCDVDGDVYAQPLYVAQLPMSDGQKHNVVFIATMHDSVYAFDAEDPSCTALWVKKYATNDLSVQPVPVADTASCGDIHTEYGITGTPVISSGAGRIYFVTKTREGGQYYQRLHALDITSGAEPQAATTISATVGAVSFSPLWQNQRPGLALANGKVYVAWGAHCDFDNYHGWLMAFDAATLGRVGAFNSTPSGSAGGIWMAGGAPAIDTAGNLYVTTGNGTFDYTSAVVPPLAPSADYGESYLKLDANLNVIDFYTPGGNAAWTGADLDLSSSAVTVLPDGVGAPGHTQLVAGSDKQRHLWLLDRQAAGGGTAMGGFDPADALVYRFVDLPNPGPSCSYQEVFGTPVYYAATSTLYLAADTGGILAVPLATVTAASNLSTITPAATTADKYGFPPPIAVVSAAGASDTGGVLWALDNSNYGGGDCNTTLGPAVLRAYNPATLARLYSSGLSGADVAGNAIKFQQPVVANGHVYVAGAGTLTVYGLLP